MLEIWRPVRGYEGVYEVSDLGRVRSLERAVTFGNRKRIVRPRALSVNIKPNGYLFVALCAPGLPQKSQYVHRLVAEAFLAPPSPGQTEVNHLSGVKSDNHAENLEWCSRSGNMLHAFDTGLQARNNPNAYHAAGSKHGNSKLTEELIPQIREWAASGNSLTWIAGEVGVSTSTIWKVVNGLRWGPIATLSSPYRL